MVAVTIALDVLTEKARVAVREALMQWRPFPQHFRENLVVGTEFLGDDRIFELYVATDPPEDAIVLARVKVNSRTGAVGTVEVFSERWTLANRAD